MKRRGLDSAKFWKDDASACKRKRRARVYNRLRRAMKKKERREALREAEAA